MSERQPYLGGNWKMNTAHASATDLARSIAAGVAALSNASRAQIAVFPPFPYLLGVDAVLRDRGGYVKLGAQDVYHQNDGAFTGEISTTMLKDCGCISVLAGHSERRHVIGETDSLINAKLRAGLEAGMTVVLCIGETLQQRESGQTNAVNESQLRAGLENVESGHLEHVVIAYEPVWAIGTGKTASPKDAQDAHANIRTVLRSLAGDHVADTTRIIYGGSVKPGNAAELFAQPDIDGGLIGGAALNADDFLAIAKAIQHDS